MAMKNKDFDKVVQIDTRSGKRHVRVIVLSETDDNIVYIPMNGINRVDYIRLKKMYEGSELDLLTTMRDEALDNGRNALVTYKDIISVYNKPKPKQLTSDSVGGSSDERVSDSTKGPETTGEQPKQRRKPGPRPGAKKRKEEEAAKKAAESQE